MFLEDKLFLKDLELQEKNQKFKKVINFMKMLSFFQVSKQLSQ